MKYGLLADIHESSLLRAAIDALRSQAVHRILVLGDVFETGSRLEGTTEQLRDAKAIGVWGNHDFGLCHEPSDFARSRFSAVCLEFMASLQPMFEFEDCLITHVEPYRDPYDFADLWSLEDDSEPARSFVARTQGIMIHGHHHKWKAWNLQGLVDWWGERPLLLDSDDRYVIQIAAVCDGYCAVLDTSERVLTPISLRAEDELRART